MANAARARDPYDLPFVPPVVYPESDGKPMAETERHLRQTTLVHYGLSTHLRSREDKYVGANMLLYYEEGDPARRVAPDVFVVLGAAAGERRTWKLWAEGRAPDVVFEITSRGTKSEDLGIKKGIYEYLGVREYFLVDPIGEYLEPPAQGFRLGPDGYARIVGEAPHSEVLGLRIERRGDLWRLVDVATGRLLPTPEEERERADAEHARAEAERERAEAERERAEAAEAEIAKLRAELAKARQG